MIGHSIQIIQMPYFQENVMSMCKSSSQIKIKKHLEFNSQFTETMKANNRSVFQKNYPGNVQMESWPTTGVLKSSVLPFILKGHNCIHVLF